MISVHNYNVSPSQRLGLLLAGTCLNIPFTFLSKVVIPQNRGETNVRLMPPQQYDVHSQLMPPISQVTSYPIPF